MCISGIKVGAAPGTAPKPAAGDPAPYVRLFGRKLAALPSAKFSVVRAPTRCFDRYLLSATQSASWPLLQ